LARVVRGRLAEAIEVTGDKRRPVRERIHRARTSCKKARAALKLIRSQEEKLYRRENRALGDAARDLSALRDADTMLDSFDAALRHYAIPREKFRAVRAALLAHRRAFAPARAEVDRRLHAFVQRLRKVAQRLDGWEPDAGFAALAADFGQAYRRARCALHAVQAQPGAAVYHEWRKATKAYSYQCRLLCKAWPAAMKALGDELKQLATRLGDEHDLTVLRGRLRQLARKNKLDVDEDTCAAILGLVATRRDELRAEVIPLGERLFADKPRAVVARITRWWDVAMGRTRLRRSPLNVRARGTPGIQSSAVRCHETIPCSTPAVATRQRPGRA
jgi:CHAD domain-containing protein